MISRISFSCFWIGLTIYYITYERLLNRKKHIISIASAVMSILLIVLPYELALFQVHAYAIGLIGTYFYVTLYHLIKLSQKDLRAATGLIMIGSIFLIAALIMLDPNSLALQVVSLTFLAPLSWMVGVILSVLPSIINPDYLVRGTSFWRVICLISPIFFLFIVIVHLIGGLLDLAIFFIVLFILILFLNLKLNKFLKLEQVTNINPKDGVLGVFARSKKVSEEEITMYRDQAVCLVCKGKISSFSYICGHCKALYCEKCVRALIDMENVCWACESPLDPLKPVKKSELKDEIANPILSEDSHKGDKKPQK